MYDQDVPWLMIAVFAFLLAYVLYGRAGYRRWLKDKWPTHPDNPDAGRVDP